MEKKPYFQELLSTRKMQAKRSVLVRIMKKDDIPYAITCCEKYGCIKNAYSYSSEMEDIRKVKTIINFYFNDSDNEFQHCFKKIMLLVE